MTPEELLDINPRLGKVASFIKEHPECNVRFWDDATVDITIPRTAALAGFISRFVCPSCGSTTAGPDMSGHDVKGTFRECRDCGIRFFIHNMVKFGGTPT